jgi:hypothetical protein
MHYGLERDVLTTWIRIIRSKVITVLHRVIQKNWTTFVHYRNQKITLLVPVLSQMKPLQFTPYFFMPF